MVHTPSSDTDTASLNTSGLVGVASSASAIAPNRHSTAAHSAAASLLFVKNPLIVFPLQIIA